MEPLLIEVPIPSMGATVSELTVIDVRVQPGAIIKKGEKIAELESDKSVFEFEAPCDGVIQAIVGREGDILPSGAPFLRIQTADESLRHLVVKDTAAAVPAKALNGTNGHHAANAPAVPVKPVVVSPTSGLAPIKAATNGIQWTPRATKLAIDAGLDPVVILDIQATGPGGRVSGDDVVRYLAHRPAPQPTVAGSPSTAAGQFLPYSQETGLLAGT